MAEGAERNIDQPRPDRRQLLRRQAADAQGAGTISLREHIRLAHQPAQHIDIARRAQIELRRQLAVPGIQFLVAQVGQMRGGDLHDVGAVLGQRARAGRAGEHARQVEHADARERPIAGRQRLGRAVADAHDLHQRQRGDGGGLRMSRPFRLRAHHAAGALGGDDRLLQVGGVPGRNGARHRVAILRHAEHAERGRAMVGEIAVQIAPAAVLGRIDAHDAVARGETSRRRASCSGRCAAKPWPGEDRPPRAGAARCESPTARRPRARSQPVLQHRPRRCGTASAAWDRYRR